jgi:uncharacterized protein YecE (DUF72 family)
MPSGILDNTGGSLPARTAVERVNVWIGTSGYNYPEWRGSFYPSKLPAAQMLPYYSARFASVEINNTFYRMPNAQTLLGWSAATPEHFKLTLKAPRRITHEARLRDCAASVERLVQLAATLEAKRGALLFQLPPFLRKDCGLLSAFIATLPPDSCAAFEFRHPSWFDDELYALLAARGLALCIADSEKLSTPVQITASYAYFRLRDEGYTLADIERWAKIISERTVHCHDVFVYFKHEESGTGPEFARLLQRALDAGGAASS